MSLSLAKRVSAALFLTMLALSLTGYAGAVPGIRSSEQSARMSASDNRLFLPLLSNGAALAPQSVFGVEVLQYSAAAVAPRVSDVGAAWVRYNGIVWSDIETQRGAPDFGKLAAVDFELQALAQQGARPIVIVRGTPSWAQQVPGSACGPIRADARADFARFMRQIVDRYSRPPFNVQYWEIGNEPDVDPSLVSPDSQFGCWGNLNDDYYGGGSYGEMLKVVYPAIKETAPSAQVVLGGLLLDCNPADRGAACKSAHFLEGVLRSGAGSAFDLVAYHGYSFWSATARDWDQIHPHWGKHGGPIIGKLNFIRQVLARYNVNKPIMMNEGGLLCVASCDNRTYADQANYVVRLYSRTWANNLVASIWYTLTGPGWRESGLLDARQQPKPAYKTFQFLTLKLGGGSYLGSIGGNGYEGYAFRNGSKTYRIYWTNSASRVAVSLPAGNVYNMYGQPIAAPSSVGFEPIIVESNS